MVSKKVQEHKCVKCGEIFTKKLDLNKHVKFPCYNVDINDRTTLSNIFKKCMNIVRNEGITGENALKNISHLLVYRLLEQHINNKIIDIENHDYNICWDGYTEEEIINQKNELFRLTKFSNFIQEKEAGRLSLFKDIWNTILGEHPKTKEIFMKDKFLDIKYDTTFTSLLTAINEFDMSKTDYDVLGQIYEDIIKDGSTNKALGQYFTMPIIKNLMVNMIDPKIMEDGKIEKIGDLAMGTGGFLITSLKYIINKAEKDNIKLDWDYIMNEGIYGKEINTDTYQLALSNMLISSGHIFNNLHNGDSIRTYTNQKFDALLINMPFGIKGLNYNEFRYPELQDYLPIKSKNSVLLFLQAVIHTLKIEGRAAVIVPNGKELNSKNSKEITMVREYLLKTCNVLEVINLPPGIFVYTSINTSILYFIKKVEGSEVLITTEEKKKIKVIKTQSFVDIVQTKEIKFYNFDNVNKEKVLLDTININDIINKSYSLSYNDYKKKEENNSIKFDNTIIYKTLGELCDIKIGGTPLRSNNEYYKDGTNLWVSVSELNNNYIYDTKEKINDIGIKNSNVKLLQTNTILFSFKLSIGKVAIAGVPLYTNEAIAGLYSNNEQYLLNKYLYYYLLIQDFKDLGSGILGNGSLNKDSLSMIQIPIPCIEKQNYIVQKLDDITQDIQRLEDVISSTKRRIQDYFKSYVNEERKIECKTLGELCDINNGTRIVKDKCEVGEYPVYGGGDITFYTNNYNRSGKTCKISREGMSLHNCVMILNIKYYLNSQALTIESSNINILINEYLWYYLYLHKHLIYECGRGAAQKAIDMEYFKNIQIPIPTLDIQNEIVQTLDRNYDLIKQTEENIKFIKDNNKKYFDNLLY